MKKIIAILLAGMMTASALAGCGGTGGESSAPNNESSSNADSSDVQSITTDVNGVADASAFGDEDNITLTVWAPDAAVDLTQKQCEEFKKLYPDKNITITVNAQGENEAGTQIQTDPKKGADVFGLASDQLDSLVAAKILSPNPFVEAVSAANSEESVSTGMFDNELYYYPETTNGYFLVYDKSVVSDEQAKTLEGVLEACRAADKQFIMSAGDGFYSCIFTFTGGVLLDGFEEGKENVQKFTDYDEDTAVATLSAFAQLFKDYKGTFISLEVAKISSGFKNGTLGAGIDGSWDAVADKNALGDNFGAAKLPTINVNGEDKQIISLYGYKGLGVNAYSQFPNAAHILAYYLSGEQCQQERAEQLAWGPTNNTVVESDYVKSQPDLIAAAEQSKHSVPQIHIGNFWDPMAALGNALISDKCDPTDTAALKDLLDSTIVSIKDE